LRQPCRAIVYRSTFDLSRVPIAIRAGMAVLEESLEQVVRRLTAIEEIKQLKAS
jgi:hypothetical protein